MKKKAILLLIISSLYMISAHETRDQANKCCVTFSKNGLCIWGRFPASNGHSHKGFAHLFCCDRIMSHNNNEQNKYFDMLGNRPQLFRELEERRHASDTSGIVYAESAWKNIIAEYRYNVQPPLPWLDPIYRTSWIRQGHHQNNGMGLVGAYTQAVDQQAFNCETCAPFHQSVQVSIEDDGSMKAFDKNKVLMGVDIDPDALGKIWNKKKRHTEEYEVNQETNMYRPLDAYTYVLAKELHFEDTYICAKIKCGDGLQSFALTGYSPCVDCPHGKVGDGNRCIDCVIGKRSSDWPADRLDDFTDTYYWARDGYDVKGLNSLEERGLVVNLLLQLGSIKKGGYTIYFSTVKHRYKSSSSTHCVSCERPYYQPVAGQSNCIVCPVNSEWASASACVCARNFFSGLGFPPCTPCFDFEYTQNSGSRFCLSCEKGQRLNDARTGCQQCENGKINDVGAVKQCSLCPAGHVSLADRLTCAECTAGTYVKEHGAYTCITSVFPTTCEFGCDRCGNNYYSAKAATECIKCPKGKYSLHTSSSCLQCAVNNFLNPAFLPKLSMHTSIHPCVLCDVCDIDTIRVSCLPDDTTEGVCLNCRAGKYVNVSVIQGEDPCYICPANSFLYALDTHISTVCSPCPNNSVSRAGSTNIANCVCQREKGFVPVYMDAARNFQCQCLYGMYENENQTCTDCGVCRGRLYRKGCALKSAGECAPCENNCPPGFFRAGCGGLSEGTCKKKTDLVRTPQCSADSTEFMSASTGFGFYDFESVFRAREVDLDFRCSAICDGSHTVDTVTCDGPYACNMRTCAEDLVEEGNMIPVRACPVVIMPEDDESLKQLKRREQCVPCARCGHVRSSANFFEDWGAGCVRECSQLLCEEGMVWDWTMKGCRSCSSLHDVRLCRKDDIVRYKLGNRVVTGNWPLLFFEGCLGGGRKLTDIGYGNCVACDAHVRSISETCASREFPSACLDIVSVQCSACSRNAETMYIDVLPGRWSKLPNENIHVRLHCQISACKQRRGQRWTGVDSSGGVCRRQCIEPLCAVDEILVPCRLPQPARCDRVYPPPTLSLTSMHMRHVGGELNLLNEAKIHIATNEPYTIEYLQFASFENTLLVTDRSGSMEYQCVWNANGIIDNIATPGGIAHVFWAPRRSADDLYHERGTRACRLWDVTEELVMPILPLQNTVSCTEEENTTNGCLDRRIAIDTEAYVLSYRFTGDFGLDKPNKILASFSDSTWKPSARMLRGPHVGNIGHMFLMLCMHKKNTHLVVNVPPHRAVQTARWIQAFLVSFAVVDLTEYGPSLPHANVRVRPQMMVDDNDISGSRDRFIPELFWAQPVVKEHVRISTIPQKNDMQDINSLFSATVYLSSKDGGDEVRECYDFRLGTEIAKFELFTSALFDITESILFQKQNSFLLKHFGSALPFETYTVCTFDDVETGCDIMSHEWKKTHNVFASKVAFIVHRMENDDFTERVYVESPNREQPLTQNVDTWLKTTDSGNSSLLCDMPITPISIAAELCESTIDKTFLALLDVYRNIPGAPDANRHVAEGAARVEYEIQAEIAPIHYLQQVHTTSACSRCLLLFTTTGGEQVQCAGPHGVHIIQDRIPATKFHCAITVVVNKHRVFLVLLGSMHVENVFGRSLHWLNDTSSSSREIANSQEASTWLSLFTNEKTVTALYIVSMEENGVMNQMLAIALYQFYWSAPRVLALQRLSGTLVLEHFTVEKKVDTELDPWLNFCRVLSPEETANHTGNILVACVQKQNVLSFEGTFLVLRICLGSLDRLAVCNDAILDLSVSSPPSFVSASFLKYVSLGSIVQELWAVGVLGKMYTVLFASQNNNNAVSIQRQVTSDLENKHFVKINYLFFSYYIGVAGGAVAPHIVTYLPNFEQYIVEAQPAQSALYCIVVVPRQLNPKLFNLHIKQNFTVTEELEYVRQRETLVKKITLHVRPTSYHVLTKNGPGLPVYRRLSGTMTEENEDRVHVSKHAIFPDASALRNFIVSYGLQENNMTLNRRMGIPVGFGRYEPDGEACTFRQYGGGISTDNTGTCLDDGFERIKVTVLQGCDVTDVDENKISGIYAKIKDHYRDPLYFLKQGIDKTQYKIIPSGQKQWRDNYGIDTATPPQMRPYYQRDNRNDPRENVSTRFLYYNNELGWFITPFPFFYPADPIQVQNFEHCLVDQEDLSSICGYWKIFTPAPLKSWSGTDFDMVNTMTHILNQNNDRYNNGSIDNSEGFLPPDLQNPDQNSPTLKSYTWCKVHGSPELNTQLNELYAKNKDWTGKIFEDYYRTDAKLSITKYELCCKEGRHQQVQISVAGCDYGGGKVDQISGIYEYYNFSANKKNHLPIEIKIFEDTVEKSIALQTYPIYIRKKSEDTTIDQGPQRRTLMYYDEDEGWLIGALFGFKQKDECKQCWNLNVRDYIEHFLDDTDLECCYGVFARLGQKNTDKDGVLQDFRTLPIHGTTIVANLWCGVDDGTDPYEDENLGITYNEVASFRRYLNGGDASNSLNVSLSNKCDREYLTFHKNPGIVLSFLKKNWQSSKNQWLHLEFEVPCVANIGSYLHPYNDAVCALPDVTKIAKRCVSSSHVILIMDAESLNTKLYFLGPDESLRQESFLKSPCIFMGKDVFWIHGESSQQEPTSFNIHARLLASQTRPEHDHEQPIESPNTWRRERHILKVKSHENMQLQLLFSRDLVADNTVKVSVGFDDLQLLPVLSSFPAFRGKVGEHGQGLCVFVHVPNSLELTALGLHNVTSGHHDFAQDDWERIHVTVSISTGKQQAGCTYKANMFFATGDTKCSPYNASAASTNRMHRLGCTLILATGSVFGAYAECQLALPIAIGEATLQETVKTNNKTKENIFLGVALESSRNISSVCTEYNPVPQFVVSLRPHTQLYNCPPGQFHDIDDNCVTCHLIEHASICNAGYRLPGCPALQMYSSSSCVPCMEGRFEVSTGAAFYTTHDSYSSVYEPCGWKCSDGYYEFKNNFFRTCRQCSEKMKCLPGFRWQNCSYEHDSGCVPCEDLRVKHGPYAANTRYIDSVDDKDSCKTECKVESYYSHLSVCKKCADRKTLLVNAGVGFFALFRCNATADGYAIRCEENSGVTITGSDPGEGIDEDPFHGKCTTKCSPGYRSIPHPEDACQKCPVPQLSKGVGKNLTSLPLAAFEWITNLTSVCNFRCLEPYSRPTGINNYACVLCDPCDIGYYPQGEDCECNVCTMLG